MQHDTDRPRLIVSALRGGAGKTTVAIGIIAALKNLGKRVAPFKKGPDYIDAGWLSMAAGVPARNLDPFFIPSPTILHSFFSHTAGFDIAVIEGNRGLHDGIDINGSTSTAEIAKLLKAPVLLCVDCTKTTRTMAALVAGCAMFDESIKIGGVVLNRIAGSRHEAIVRKSIEYYCDIPVVGAIPRLAKKNFPERHMGLVPTHEHRWARDAISEAADIAARHIDLDAVLAMARSAPAFGNIDTAETDLSGQSATGETPLTIAVARDAAFQFYYPENIEALEAAGAKVVFTSPLYDPKLPPGTDALYLGGGFPETHAALLAKNESYRNQVKRLAKEGMPIYAECGGLIYLGRELVLDGTSFPMCGVFRVSFGISGKPVGHGYTVSTVDRENPYFPTGSTIRGHEFRYSTVMDRQEENFDLVFSTTRGKGFADGRDGLCKKNVLAAYTHIHALGTPGWANAMVKNASIFHETKNKNR